MRSDRVKIVGDDSFEVDLGPDPLEACIFDAAF
jgi:hypothetical protein